jgi:hypothetical protein
MTAPSRQYAGVPGFALDDAPAPTPPERTPSNPSQNTELVDDLTRFAEGLLSESAVRKKWRLSEEIWEAFGSDDELVRAIEEAKIHRVRNGSFKRERSQQLVTSAPDVLSGLLLNEKNSPKHRIDAAKTLDAFAANGPQNETEQDRIHIVINLGADLKAQGREPNPDDVITIDAAPRPSTQKQITDESDEWRR